MKIHSLTTQGSKIIKVYSLFPFFGFAASLSIWAGNKSSFLLFPIVLFFFMFIYTLLFARHELYIDIKNKKVIKKIKWLFIKSTTEVSLSEYKGIYVSLGDSVGKSSLNGITKTRTYDVVLVHKYAVTNTASGLNIMDNFLLKCGVKNLNEVRSYVIEFSRKLDICASVEEQLAKTHPNLLKHGEEF